MELPGGEVAERHASLRVGKQCALPLDQQKAIFKVQLRARIRKRMEYIFQSANRILFPKKNVNGTILHLAQDVGFSSLYSAKQYGKRINFRQRRIDA